MSHYPTASFRLAKLETALATLKPTLVTQNFYTSFDF